MKTFGAIHQFHSGTAVGDAITNQMLSLRQHFRNLGFESEIFAEHIPAALQGRITSIHGYQGSRDELLFTHHSIGHDAFDDVIGLPNPIVTVYHNVTPEEYFRDETVRRYIRLGREQLGLLALRSSAGVAASNFNRREMLAAGFRRVDVLPVRVDFSGFRRTASTAHRDSTDWLFVGRLVGNKCQHELVAAFAIYARHFDPRARLLLIGDTSDEEYSSFVSECAERLGIADRVVLLGKVSDRQLAAAYAGASVFVSMSEHEGFGVPLLEAMAANVPVVAFGATAIPETMGGAGILLRQKDPTFVAATVQSVLSDPVLRDRLVARQSARIEQIGRFDVDALLQRVVKRAAGELTPLEVQIQGPFETSYSLAMMNRKLALGLAGRSDRELSIYATEGPGDYVPRGRISKGSPTPPPCTGGPDRCRSRTS